METFAVLAPLLVLAAVFIAYCLYDLVQAPSVRHLPKPVWALVILVSIPLGGVIYLFVGREPHA